MAGSSPAIDRGKMTAESSRRSDRAAASIAPGEAVGADAPARHHHDGRRDHDPGSHHPGSDYEGAAIRPTSTIGTAMKAGPASAGGVRGAETSERAGNQNCCEKGLHVSSV